MHSSDIKIFNCFPFNITKLSDKPRKFKIALTFLCEGWLISNATNEIFCRRSKVARRAQCVLVATTLLHSGAKCHSFLYTGSKTVRVNMESCYGGMSTRLKQRAVTEFLSAENVTPAEIHRRLQAVYGDDTVSRTTAYRWAIKFRECEPGRANIVDHPRSGRPVSVTDDKHQKQVDELIKHYRRITQEHIAGRLGMSKERVGYIVGLLGYTNVDAGKETKSVEICEELLKRYREEGDHFLLNIVPGDE